MTNKWHKTAEDDLPKEGGNYWCKLKDKYIQGSSHYKQHCNNGYCILQWLPKKKAWNVRYNTEVEAWIELPKYNEEQVMANEAEKQALIDKACEWWENELTYPTMTQADMFYKESMIEEFKQAMKGGEQ